ncbi:MAG TPA: hypothetical protein VM120_09485 [Bryobacteraceae bacterium]|nr:hypothetical protein [Bryobacteraceae bacterium]
MALTFFSAWLATMLYVAAEALWLLRADRQARVWWSVGCACLLTHAASAFHYVHHWSHREAYIATARQTADFFPVSFGGGIYLNYVFTLLWVADAVWWWRGLLRYRTRPSWITGSIHGFLAFLFFNATVVFGQGWIPWAGVAATLLLLAILIRIRWH